MKRHHIEIRRVRNDVPVPYFAWRVYHVAGNGRIVSKSRFFSTRQHAERNALAMVRGFWPGAVWDTGASAIWRPVTSDRIEVRYVDGAR